ncbi:DUF1543 domain-containing protein [Pedobacter psychroterrae]|uniref:DUF1543 domain-containing protein n=1 Tax=Pedobacter psychroterrae TaxID=2530453 RepID=A0A4R0NT23_9SPHI|nr:DUF1543 domain-containing protein [Pedobacter psychroterrae]TCD03299.1 DUF1543 domain-containing protein [Pedobacter psychroterrae]
MNELQLQPGTPRLYMVLLGSKAPRRNVEQHDYFFGIADSLKELIPQMRAFWPEAGDSLHIDGWREVNVVDGYEVKVVPRTQSFLTAEKAQPAFPEKLFFINLGGYQTGKLEEQHYTVLSVKTDRAQAVQEAKKTIFFKSNKIKGANSHIDEKYGIDVDDIYKIEEILDPALKENFHIEIVANAGLPADQVHLGYFKLDKL